MERWILHVRYELPEIFSAGSESSVVAVIRLYQHVFHVQELRFKDKDASSLIECEDSNGLS